MHYVYVGCAIGEDIVGRIKPQQTWTFSDSFLPWTYITKLTHTHKHTHTRHPFTCKLVICSTQNISHNHKAFNNFFHFLFVSFRCAPPHIIPPILNGMYVRAFISTRDPPTFYYLDVRRIAHCAHLPLSSTTLLKYTSQEIFFCIIYK